MAIRCCFTVYRTLTCAKMNAKTFGRRFLKESTGFLTKQEAKTPIR